MNITLTVVCIVFVVLIHEIWSGCIFCNNGARSSSSASSSADEFTKPPKLMYDGFAITKDIIDHSATFAAQTFAAQTFAAQTFAAQTFAAQTFAAQTFAAQTFAARLLRPQPK
uniref:Uncharacterized protein n=1 Tax=Globodera rostochiensis TaxID=31243 RepID=A0A914H6D5_GLORO